jgi:putative peptidoglycan lipid II flippase
MGDAAMWLELSVVKRLMHLSWLVALGMGVYFAVLFILGFRPRDFSRKALH